MGITMNAGTKQKLLDEACAMIEEMGGVGVLIDDLEMSRKLYVRMANEHASLIKKYPDKWVAMGEGGVVAAGDSKDEALDAIEHRGIRRLDAVVEFMDTDPPVLIL